jgi:hypothetical protein
LAVHIKSAQMYSHTWLVASQSLDIAGDSGLWSAKFFKVKTDKKNYLRTRMSQLRFVDLAIIYTERDMTRKLVCSDTVGILTLLKSSEVFSK